MIGKHIGKHEYAKLMVDNRQRFYRIAYSYVKNEHEALDTLGAEDKSFIILKYFEGYSFRDISKLFQIPESTVKSKVYRCLERMRIYMEGGSQSC